VGVIYYFYAVVGMEIFSDPAHAGDKCQAPGLVQSQPQDRYCDFANSLFTLFQLTMGQDWHVNMYNAIEERNFYAAWYFVTFIILVVTVLLNLMTAVFLDSFMLERTLQNQREMELTRLLRAANRSSDDAG
jgi:hypothetical protein